MTQRQKTAVRKVLGTAARYLVKNIKVEEWPEVLCYDFLIALDASQSLTGAHDLLAELHRIVGYRLEHNDWWTATGDKPQTNKEAEG